MQKRLQLEDHDSYVVWTSLCDLILEHLFCRIDSIALEDLIRIVATNPLSHRSRLLFLLKVSQLLKSNQLSSAAKTELHRSRFVERMIAKHITSSFIQSSSNV